MHTLSVVIPVYRSERILPDLYGRLWSALWKSSPQTSKLFSSRTGAAINRGRSLRISPAPIIVFAGRE